MRFVVDAQMPRRLARWLGTCGHNVLHTLDLPFGNRTSDAEITDLACREERVVVTKDSDFVETYLISKRPPKLLLVTTGNMGNEALVQIFEKNLSAIESALNGSDFVELSRDRLIIHD